MFPSDVQLVIDPTLVLEGLDVSDGIGDDLGGGGGAGTFRVNRAIVLCSPLKRPGAFLARFSGSGAPLPVAPLDVTASGRISETVKSGVNTHYEDEAVIVYDVAEANTNKLMLPVELEDDLDDVFRMDVISGLQPAPGADTHRVSSIEPLIRRGPGTFPGDKLLQLSPISSNVLDTQGGTLGTLKDIPDVDVATPPRTPVGFDTRGRFFGYRIRGSNIHSLLRLLGTFLRGHRL